jgi:hypothetical protein
MRRLLLVAAGLAALTVSAPATALASHGHHHHHKRKGHHAKVRFEHIGPGGTTATGPGTVTSSPSATPPATPTTTENAGKVASYTGGVLTLTLNDGSSVSGKVTNATRIECVSATAPPAGPGQGQDNGPPNNNGPGDDNGAGDDNHQGDQQGGGPPPTPSAGAPQWMQGEDGNDDGEENPAASEPPCDTSALLAGAVVREAELRIGSGGTEFESIELVR